jgi:hypothetical protein
MRAANHVNQRNIYFADPDGNVLEIDYQCLTRWNCSPTAAATGTRRFRSAVPATHRHGGCSKSGRAPRLQAKIERLRRRKEMLSG